MLDLLDPPSFKAEHSARPTEELFTSPDWIAVVSDTYGLPVHAVIDRDNNHVLPFGALDDLAGKRLISLPFSDYVLLPYPLDAVRKLADVARDAFPEFSMSIRLAGAAPDSTERNSWRITQNAVYHRLSPAAEPALWSGLSQGFRNQVRQAQRHGVTVRRDNSIEAVDRFFALHASLRNRKFASIPQPRRFFHRIHERFFAAEKGFALEAWYDGAVVATCIVLRHGGQLYYKFSTSSASAGAVRANNLMLWELVRIAGEEGLTLDFGRSGLGEGYAGLRHFKEALGATGAPLLAMTHEPANPDHQAAARAAEFASVAGAASKLLAAAELDEGGNDAAAELLYRYFA